jgi:hypothetical protein
LFRSISSIETDINSTCHYDFPLPCQKGQALLLFENWRLERSKEEAKALHADVILAFHVG